MDHHDNITVDKYVTYDQTSSPGNMEIQLNYHFSNDSHQNDLATNAHISIVFHHLIRDSTVLSPGGVYVGSY